MPKAARYAAVFSHPAIPVLTSTNRKYIVRMARIGVRETGGSARVACDGKEFYQCWQSRTARAGVRGHYINNQRLKDKFCPECHAPLRDGVKQKFNVAPKVALGKTCSLCGQMGMQL